MEAAGVSANLRPQLDGPTRNETEIVYSADLVLRDAHLRILGLIS